MDPTTTIHHVLKVQIDSEPLLVPLSKWVVTYVITTVRSTLTDVVKGSLPEIITHSHYYLIHCQWYLPLMYHSVNFLLNMCHLCLMDIQEI